MNEREFILRMVIALANKSGYNEFEAAKEFAAEARKCGLFDDPAPDAGEAQEQLAAVVRKPDQLVAEAFNAATETGLTPRQLAEQRAELLGQALEALEAARIELENEGAWVPTKVTAVLALAKGEK